MTGRIVTFEQVRFSTNKVGLLFNRFFVSFRNFDTTNQPHTVRARGSE